jgi:hypothetical protein
VLVEAGATGLELLLLLTDQSLQVGSQALLVLVTLAGEEVVEAETLQSLQVWSAPEPPLYGQLVTVGSQEVMVTSTVSVMVVVPAEARATKPAARTIEVRILLDLVVFWFKLPKSEGYLRKANDVDVWLKRVWASRTRKEWTTEGQGFAWILKSRLEYRKRGKIAALGILSFL